MEVERVNFAKNKQARYQIYVLPSRIVWDDFCWTPVFKGKNRALITRSGILIELDFQSMVIHRIDIIYVGVLCKF